MGNAADITRDLREREKRIFARVHERARRTNYGVTIVLMRRRRPIHETSRRGKRRVFENEASAIRGGIFQDSNARGRR